VALLAGIAMPDLETHPCRPAGTCSVFHAMHSAPRLRNSHWRPGVIRLIGSSPALPRRFVFWAPKLESLRLPWTGPRHPLGIFAGSLNWSHGRLPYKDHPRILAASTGLMNADGTRFILGLFVAERGGTVVLIGFPGLCTKKGRARTSAV
jgi:hypothetical protein